jgi:hypothetical protein
MKIALIAAVLAFCGPDPSPQGVAVDAAKKTVRVPCKVAPRKLANLPEIYPIEVVATWPAPKGQKAHETVVTFEVQPSEVHKALESVGLKPGKPGRGEDPCAGPELEVLLEIPGANNAPAREIRIESVMMDRRTGRPLPPVKWHFTGSALKDGKFGADVSGTLIALYPVTDEVVMQSGLTMREEGMIKVETIKTQLPAEGSPVTLLIRPAAGPPPAVAAAAADPEKQVMKFSKGVGPADAPAPTVSVGSGASSSGSSADPFEHRKEVRPGKSLPDSSRPIDVPKQ